MTEKRNDEYAVRSVCTTPCKYEKHVAKTDLLRAFFPLKLNLTHSVVRHSCNVIRMSAIVSWKSNMLQGIQTKEEQGSILLTKDFIL